MFWLKNKKICSSVVQWASFYALKTIGKRENAYFLRNCLYLHVFTRAVASNPRLFRLWAKPI